MWQFGILNSIPPTHGEYLFAVIFIVFALSFFGFYEIGLPQQPFQFGRLQIERRKRRRYLFYGAYAGYRFFFLYGPILGTLLVDALNQSGGAVQLSVLWRVWGWHWDCLLPCLLYSQLAFFVAPFRRMDEYGKNRVWLC